MGFFDKLRDTVNTAKESINKAMEAAQNANDPLSDPVVKKYFEIICGMRHSFLATGPAFLATGPEPVTENVLAKKYVEYFLGEACDEQKLQKTLELYNISRTEFPNDKTEEILSDFRKSLRNSTNYTLGYYEAHKIFYQDEIKETEVAYDKILDVIRDNVNYKLFTQGVRSLGKNSALINIAIANSFNNGNPITQQIVLEYFIDIFINRMRNEQGWLLDPHDAVALATIKALHFDKYGADKTNYPTISDEEYRDFVLNVNYYKKAIYKNPFATQAEIEKLIEKFIKYIRESEILYSPYSSYKSRDYYHITCVDDYNCDCICYHAWKQISEAREWVNRDDDDISDSKCTSDVFNILCTYFNNPDEDCDFDTEPFYNNDEESTDVEVYNIISDDARSLLGTIDLEDESTQD